MSLFGRAQGVPGEAGRINPKTSSERIIERAELGEHRIDADAAREIAQQIEDGGGFWGPRKK